jgi:hypothetical protein
MNHYYNGVDSSAYLAHYGVLGMKWGQHLMAKYETNRAGRALKRTITNKKDSGKYERAQKTLSKYESKYSKSDIAASAQRSAKRANTATKVINTFGQASGVVGGIGSAATGLGAAALLVAAPAAYGAVASMALGGAAYSAAVSGGTYAFNAAAKRNSNTSYKYVVSELEKYSKS